MAGVRYSCTGVLGVAGGRHSCTGVWQESGTYVQVCKMKK